MLLVHILNLLSHTELITAARTALSHVWPRGSTCGEYCTVHTPDQQGGVYDCPHNVVPYEALRLLRNGVGWQLFSRVSLDRTAAKLTRLQWLPILEHTVFQIHCTCAVMQTIVM